MLTTCNKCRDTKDIRLKVENPNNLKVNKHTIQKEASIKVTPICTVCGTTANLSQFAIQNMVDKRDFAQTTESRTSKFKCHACETDQVVKLDKKMKPRCLRCGSIVKLTPLMIKCLKEDLKLFMSDKELSKFDLK